MEAETQDSSLQEVMEGAGCPPDLPSIQNLQKPSQAPSQLVSQLPCEVPVEDIVTPLGDKEPAVQSG